jgi:hypothetical protein
LQLVTTVGPVVADVQLVVVQLLFAVAPALLQVATGLGPVVAVPGQVVVV